MNQGFEEASWLIRVLKKAAGKRSNLTRKEIKT